VSDLYQKHFVVFAFWLNFDSEEKCCNGANKRKVFLKKRRIKFLRYEILEIKLKDVFPVL